LQKGYAFIHFSFNAKGIISSLQCCDELKDTIVDGVKYRCDLSHKLMKDLSESDDPYVLKIIDRNPALMRIIQKSNPTRKKKSRNAVLSALSCEAPPYQYPYLSAYMTNLNAYSSNYLHTSSMGVEIPCAMNANPYLNMNNGALQSLSADSCESMEYLINQVAFVDARDSMIATCPSIDFETGQLYTQFGPSCWNIHNASPVRRQSFAGWAQEFLPYAPKPPPPTTPIPADHGSENTEVSTLVVESVAGDVPLQISTVIEEPHPSVNYQITNPNWNHSMNSVLYPYYSYTQFPSPIPYTVGSSMINKHNKPGYSPKVRNKSFTVIRQSCASNGKQQESEESNQSLPTGFQIKSK
jgi:hypothetical protein